MQGGDVAADSSFEVERELTRLQQTLVRDGVRKVDGPGRVRADCTPNAVVDAGPECIVYGLSGTKTQPVGGTQQIRATLRIWARPADGGWEVNNYTYDARVAPG